MKLRAPAGCTSVSHDGRVYAIAADGSLDVEDCIAAALAAHGFIVWPTEAPRDVAWIAHDARAAMPPHDSAPDVIDSLNRPALFSFLRERGVRVALPITNAELRALARRAVGSTGLKP